MKILGNRILVSKVDEPKKEGFQTVDVQDSFVYKGKVEQVGQLPVCSKGIKKQNLKDAYEVFEEGIVKENDIVLFAKYSPDTQEVDVKGQKMKIIKVDDVLAIL